jgi:ABC-2 type transport system permease protein
METLFRLSLRQLTGKWRLILLVLLAALPIALAVLVALTLGEDESSNEEFVDTLLDGLLIGAVMPIISLVLATALFGNEVEDKTLNYLVLRPVERYQIVLTKWTAALLIGCSLVVASGVIATWVGAGSIGSKIVVLDSTPRGIAAVGIAVLLGSIAYTSLFTWAGLMSTRALPYALIYVVLWEGVISSFFGGIRYLSVRGYTLGLVHGLDDSSFADLSSRAIELPAALLGVAAVTVGFFYLTVRRLSEMDVP